MSSCRTTAGIAALADVPGVRAIRYRPDAPLPAEARYRRGARRARSTRPTSSWARCARLPELRLVQLLTAGAETWIGQAARRRRALGLPRRARRRDRRVDRRRPCSRSTGTCPRFAAAQAEGRWDYHTTEELAGKRVLIVGAGDVAEQTVARLAPFEVDDHAGRPPRPRRRARRSTKWPSCCPTTTRAWWSCPSPTPPAGSSTPRSSPPCPTGGAGQRRARARRGHRRAPRRADRRTAARGPRRHRSRAAARGPPAVAAPGSAAHPARRRQRAAGRWIGRSGSPPSRSRQFAAGNTPSNLVKDGY